MDVGTILEALEPFYRDEEFPVLRRQIDDWQQSRPLAGLRIIDGTPHFHNTYAKYAALLAAGCDLTVALSPDLPPNPEALEWAKQWSIPCVTPEEAKLQGPFDVVLDCGGALCEVESKRGYVELTRSGVERYQNCAKPVWVVDDSRVKQIETCMGTGDGFIRGMAASGFPIRRGTKVMVIGFGKVGWGIFLMSSRAGAKLTVVDADPGRASNVPEGADFIPLSDLSAVRQAVQEMDVVVTATGVLHAVRGVIRPEDLDRAHCLCANMGVEDEWGPEIPRERLLHAGKALNFILKDPTQMCYIDPPMALHNAGAVQLAHHDYAPGLHAPESEIEDQIMALALKS